MELKKYCDIIPGYAYKSEDFAEGQYRVVKIKDINPPFINHDLDSVRFKADDRFKLINGDYVLAMTGATIGKVGRFQGKDDITYINQRVCKFVVKANIADEDYLFYLLNTTSFKNFVLSNVDSSSAQPNISHNTLYSFKHDFPKLEVQQKIGATLSALDRKIALNRQINDNLVSPDRSLEEVEVHRVA